MGGNKRSLSNSDLRHGHRLSHAHRARPVVVLGVVVIVVVVFLVVIVVVIIDRLRRARRTARRPARQSWRWRTSS